MNPAALVGPTSPPIGRTMSDFVWVHESGGTIVKAENERAAYKRVIRHMASYREEQSWFTRIREAIRHYYWDHGLVELIGELTDKDVVCFNCRSRPALEDGRCEVCFNPDGSENRA